MDSSSPSSPPPPAAAEGSRSQRTTHSSVKTSLHHAAASAAAASSKPRKPSALAGKPSTKLHPLSSKIPAPPGNQCSEKKADIENLQPVVLQGLSSFKNGDEAVVKNAALKKGKAVVTDEALREQKALAEDEAVGREKPVTKAETLGQALTVCSNEALGKESDQIDPSPSQEFNQNDFAEMEKKKDDCAEKQEKKDSCEEKEEKNSDFTETSTTENGGQNLVIVVECQKNGVSLDLKQKEAVSLPPKGEATNTERPLKTTPADEFSTLKKSKEQDAPSLSQFDAAVIAASDFKVAPSDVACNGISGVPSSEATEFMEAAMVALAKDVLAAKCFSVENDQHKTVAQPVSCSWKLSRRALVIPSLVVPAVLCLVCFVTAVNKDENHYLHPT